MSLTTTMGIELTYVPEAVQIALNRGIKATPDEMKYYGENDLLDGFTRLLSLLCAAKKIPLHTGNGSGVRRDPGVVEVVTKPYKKLSTLLSVARRVTREANAIGLSEYEAYSGGGGCHVHTGVIGDTFEARTKYKGRMIAFMAQNPAFAWATLDIVDDINACPITRERLQPPGIEDRLMRDKVSYLEQIAVSLSTIKMYDNEIHAKGTSAYRKECNIRYRVEEMKRVWQVRVKINYLNKQIAAVVNPSHMIKVEDIDFAEFNNKKTVIRETPYGKHGTIEFRSFEMGDEAKIKRNIILANAVCRYVEKQTFEEFDLHSIQTANEMRATKWSDARRQWLELLAKLGLDPKEYREETAQIACRWRAYRDSAGEFKRGNNPTSVEETREYIEDWREYSYEVTLTNKRIESAKRRHDKKISKYEARAATKAYNAERVARNEREAQIAKAERLVARSVDAERAARVQASEVTDPTDNAPVAAYAEELGIPDPAECVEAESMAQSVVDDEEETFMEVFDTPTVETA